MTALVVTLAGITPLLPGLLPAGVEELADGLVTVTLALAVGLALAAGVALGDFVTRPRNRPRSDPRDSAPDVDRQ